MGDQSQYFVPAGLLDTMIGLLESGRAFVPPHNDVRAATRALVLNWLAREEELGRSHVPEGVTNSYAAAMSEMSATLWRLLDEGRADSKLAAMNLTLHTAEAEFRTGLPRLAEQLTEAAEAAKGIPEDSSVARAASAIAESLRQVDVSKLGPVGVVFLLFWLIFFHMNLTQLAGATLFYMVVSDYLKQRE